MNFLNPRQLVRNLSSPRRFGPKSLSTNMKIQHFLHIYEAPNSISDHFKSTPNVSNKSEIDSPSHFGPKRSPDTFRLEHSLVRNRPLNLEDFSHVIKIASKTEFLTRFLKICMGVKNLISDHF